MAATKTVPVQTHSKLVTREEAAAYVGISLTALDALVASRELTAYRIGGAFVRFRSEDLELYVHRQRGGAPMMGHHATAHAGARPTWRERVREFFYLHDFYLLAGLLALLLIAVVIRFT